jgi:hypothetical protein
MFREPTYRKADFPGVGGLAQSSALKINVETAQMEEVSMDDAFGLVLPNLHGCR